MLLFIYCCFIHSPTSNSHHPSLFLPPTLAVPILTSVAPHCVCLFVHVCMRGWVCVFVYAWVCVWVCVCAFSNIHPKSQHWIPSSTFLHFTFWNRVSHWTQISRNVSANPPSVGITNMSHSIWSLPLGCWVLWLWS